MASLADYVDGRLHGAWIDADTDPEELHQAVTAMLAASPMPGAEEWAIHDYDGFGPLKLSEYEPLERVAQLAAGITEHGEPFAHYAELFGGAGSELLEGFEERYLGRWESLSDFAGELWDDYGYQSLIDETLPESLRAYVRFDAEEFGRDLELGGDLVTAPASEGGIYVFGAT